MKCFFPVENSHFGRPKTNFRRFQKWKAKKKKKGPHLFLERFPASIPIFHLFLSIFTPFQFFPCLFFPDTSSKISRSEVSGGTLPPPVTPLILHLNCFVQCLHNAYTIALCKHCRTAPSCTEIAECFVHDNTWFLFMKAYSVMYIHITHLLYSYYAVYESKLFISKAYCVQCIGLMPYFNLLTEWYIIFLYLIEPVTSLYHWTLVHGNGGVCLLLLYDRIILPANCC